MENNRNRQKGFTLVAAGASALALFGAAGLAIDIGRVYIIKNEAQGYVDAAATAAAMQLDGSATGLANADAAVGASTNKWNFATAAFSGTVVEYSADGSTGWAASASAAPANMRYARVTAAVTNVPLFFLPVIGTATLTTVKALAVAGQVSEPPTVFPFSPVAHDKNDPDYGFVLGQRYDFKWPQSPTVGVGAKAPCDGDNALSWVNLVQSGPPELGGVAFSGTSGFVQQIADDTRPYDPPLAVGQYLNPTAGDKNAIIDSINARGDLDNQTDVVYVPGATSLSALPTWVTYRNSSDFTGRRIVTMMVRTGYSSILGIPLPLAQQSIGVGYAQFLLLPDYDKNGGANNAWCATYLGNDATFGIGHPGGGGIDGGGQAYVRLTQ